MTNPLERVQIGMSGTKETVVTPDLTVGHFVEGMPMVYATPMMILLMELASGVAIAGQLPEGYVSVGTRVNVAHIAATPVGRNVIASASVTAIGPTSVDFKVAAHDGDRLIGEGTHRRGIVEVAAFENRLKS